MQSGMAEFYRVLNSATELSLKQDDAAAKRAAAVRQANTMATMRAVVARHNANQPAPQIPTPNTSLASVGNVNDLPLDEGTMAQPGGMEGGPGEGSAPSGGPADLMPGGPGGKGKKSPTLFGDTARPGMSDTAQELRELGEAAIIGGEFKTGRQYIDSAIKAEKMAAEIDTEHLKQQADMADMLGSVASGVHDQQSLTNALMIASMHGMAEEAAQLYQMTGGVYNEQAKAVLDQFAESSMSVKEQAQGQIATAKLANDNRRTESMIDARNVSMTKNRQAMGIARERLDLAKNQANKKNQPKPGKPGPLRIGGKTQAEWIALWKTNKKTADQQSDFDTELKANAPTPAGMFSEAGPESIRYQELKYQKKKQGESFEQWFIEQNGVDPQGRPVDVKTEKPKAQPSVLEPPGPEEATPKPKAPAKEETYGYSEGQIKSTMEKYGKSREEVLAALKAKKAK